MTGTVRASLGPKPGSLLASRLGALALSLAGATGCGAPVPQNPAAMPGAPAPTPRAGSEALRPQAAAPTPSDAWPFGPAPSAEEQSALLARLSREPGPVKTNWVPPGKAERYGHAEALIAAPYDAVRARLLDFSHYKDLAGPKFKNVRVVDKAETTTDLYFNLPIMHGLVTIWYVTRFAPVRPGQGGEVVEGTFVKGNIKGMHLAFGMRRGPDEKSAVMTCDLSLSLNLPAPQANVDEELRDACGDAINSVRRITMPPPAPPPPLPPSPSPSPPP
jgi:hypothetical protein